MKNEYKVDLLWSLDEEPMKRSPEARKKIESTRVDFKSARADFEFFLPRGRCRLQLLFVGFK